MPARRADVAALANVSPAVVSHVLHGNRPVAKATRQRVMDAIEELNYRPNAIAQALRTNSTRTIGMIVPDFHSPFSLEMIRVVEEAAFARGRVVYVGQSRDGTESASHIASFYDRQVEGVILVSTQTWDEVKDLALPNVPIVLFDRADVVSRASTIISAEFDGARIGVEHLLRAGRRHIACIAGPRDEHSSRERIRGWRTALESSGAPLNAETLSRAPDTEEGGRSAIAAILDSHASVDALFVCSDVQAIGVLSELYRRGIRVPDDIAIVAFDGTHISRHTAPPLTVIAQRFTALAEAALACIEQGTGTDGSVASAQEIETSLIVRESAP